ncbi:hypothetical protein RDABS01_003168 [Bienertia sinuspersici]
MEECMGCQELVEGRSGGGQLDLKVADLIDFDRGCWNEGKVNECIVEEERTLVLGTPFSSRGIGDSIYWWPNSNGEYTVRSGYGLAKGGALNRWEESLSELEKKGWKLIWNMQGPPKLRHFLWRACTGFLAVMERLYARRVTSSDTCAVCENGCETVGHSLFECKFATEIWDRSKFKPLIDSMQGSSMIEALSLIAGKLDAYDWVCFAALLWASWSCRNTFLFEGGVVNGMTVAQGMHNYVLEWIDYSAKVAKPAATYLSFGLNTKSEKPPDGWLKINVDCHISEEGFVGAGAVVRNWHGDMVVAATRRTRARWDAELAEAWAARLGLRVAYRFGMDKVMLESDSLALISKLANKAQAHLIAREYVDWDCEKVWCNPFPQTFCNLASIDLM